MFSFILKLYLLGLCIIPPPAPQRQKKKGASGDDGGNKYFMFWFTLGQAKARSLDFILGLPWRWQESRYFSHHLLPPKAFKGRKQKWQSQKLDPGTLIRHTGILIARLNSCSCNFQKEMPHLLCEKDACLFYRIQELQKIAKTKI